MTLAPSLPATVDVLIIGAGPAGLAAATVAARRCWTGPGR